MVILGIDPGTATTGYGLVKSQKSKVKSREFWKCLDYGCILTDPKLTPEKRLQVIYKEMSTLLNKHRPDAVAIENVYFFKNWKTAMPVSQAKGVIMLAAAKKKVPVFEYTPLQIKSATVGYGRADKRQVQKMIKIILNLSKDPRPDDAADALGAAICHTRSCMPN